MCKFSAAAWGCFGYVGRGMFNAWNRYSFELDHCLVRERGRERDGEMEREGER
jgi:hypothetical protein